MINNCRNARPEVGGAAVVVTAGPAFGSVAGLRVALMTFAGTYASFGIGSDYDVRIHPAPAPCEAPRAAASFNKPAAPNAGHRVAVAIESPRGPGR